MSDRSAPDFNAYSLSELIEAQKGINRQKYPERAKQIDSLIAWREARGREARGRYPERIRQLPLYDGKFDAYRLSADGAQVLFAMYPAGTVIEAHTHETDNYGIITGGELTLTMNGEQTIHGVGEWYHVPAGVVHAAKFLVDTEEIEFWFAPEGG